MLKEFLFLFTIANKIVLSTIFLLLPINKKYNRLFSLLIACHIPIIVNNYFIHIEGISYYWLSIVTHIGSEAYFPLWCIYLFLILDQDLKLTKRKIAVNLIFTFGPVLIFCLQPFLGQQSFQNFRDAQIHGTFNWWFIVAYGWAVLITMFYSIYMVLKVRTIKKEQAQLFKSKNFKIRYKYVNRFTWFILIIVILDALSIVLLGPVITEIYTLQILLDIYVFYLIYEGLVSGVISMNLAKPESKKIDSKIEQEEEQEWSKIVDWLKREKLFLDSELSLEKFAEICGIPKYKISQAVSQEGKDNFNQVVNQLRIENFIETFDASYAIEQHAYDCGFKSKSTFNRVFKKETGLTPSQYLKNL